MNGLVIKDDGAFLMMEFHDDDLNADIHRVLGGFYEAVRSSDSKWCLLVDDEGWLKNKPLNTFASVLYGYPIAGHAIVFGLTMGDEGEEFCSIPHKVYLNITGAAVAIDRAKMWRW